MKTMVKIVLFILAVVVSSAAMSAPKQRKTPAMNDFAGREKMLQELFEQLDPEQMGANFRKALESKDRNALIRATAEYFRSRPAKKYCKMLLRDTGDFSAADRAAAGLMCEVNIPWQFEDGKIDWHFNPTLAKPPVNNEWLWQLNRMSFWRDLSDAYNATGDNKYAWAFNDQLRGWIASAGDVPAKDWNAAGSVWRTIETGLRMMYSWCVSFEVFRKAPEFSDENLCLMLSSKFRHAVHLKKHHKEKNNWMLMEMSGLYTFGVIYPEFKESKAMRNYAAEKFCHAVVRQILPDGMHCELSPDYHSVMASCSMVFLRIAATENVTDELPEEFTSKLEKAYESVLALATPSLVSPRTNDCFTLDVSSRLMEAYKFFPHRKDFLWAGSKRKEGSMPSDQPSSSRFQPWSGFAAMRSGWGSDALYCLFDVGPLGAGHMHQDKLNIDIWKGDQELIYDDGGGQYEKSIHRTYGISAAGHNTILVDGLIQSRKAPLVLKKPVDANWISNAVFDYARGIYDQEFGVLQLTDKDREHPLSKPAKHIREVRFFKPDFFCVVDTLISRDGKIHDYEMRLHLDTLKMKRVPEIPGAWLSDFGKSYDILVVPLYPEQITSSHLSGAMEPAMAGWYAGRNDQKLHKSSTLALKTRGKDCRFATLLIPVGGKEKFPEIKKHSREEFTLKWKNKVHRINLEKLSE